MQHTLLAVVVSLSTTTAWLAAQAPATTPPPMHRVGGPSRDGASAFPRVLYPELAPVTAGQIDFQHFHTYAETVS
ncbi:MAG TPA: hypothetical protein VNJ03_04220, partial [Vicinamibacterales bacterium]|nr:hypothetical protein [Vicinamibacterales bacterium]